MSISPVPHKKFNKITDITAEKLHRMGVTLLMMDLDNTISPYGEKSPDEATIKWVNDMKKGGIDLFIVSNSKISRPGDFAKVFDIPYVDRAKKPLLRGVKEALRRTGAKPEHTALVGDQVYTDVLAANGAGITSILVEPIKFTNPFLAIRYFFELPFRHEKRKR